MSFKRTVARNTIWNGAGLIVAMAAGFVVSPFLVRRLGDSSYGLWLVIASLTSYFGLLDLGIRGSVGRNIAFYRAKGDVRGVNSMFNTSLALLIAAGLIALLATFGLLSAFLRLFPDIAPAEYNSARQALLIVGVSLALMLPMNVFDATLWAYQRFDLINAIDIAAVVARSTLTFVLVGRGEGLVTLAWITLGVTQATGLAKAIAVGFVGNGLEIGWGHVTHDGAKTLFGYGTWSFVSTVARLLTSQFTTLIIGARLGVAVVTPYSIASRLVAYGVSLVSSVAGVMTPVATGFHAGDKDEEQRRLFLDGGKYCLAFSLYFVANFLCLGRPLVRAWMGPGRDDAAMLLVILALGEALPMGQLITTSLMLGKGRPRLLAMLYFADGLGVTLGALLLSGPFGLRGVSLGFAVSGFLARGLAMIFYGSKLVEVSVGRFLTRAILPALVTAAAPAASLAAAVACRPARGWTDLFLYGGAFTLAYALGVAVLVRADRARYRPTGSTATRPVQGRAPETVLEPIGVL